MSILRAALVAAIICVTTTSAAAEPGDHRGGYLQLSAGLTLGQLEGTETYTNTDFGGESTQRASSRGAGLGLGLTGGLDLGNGVRLGGFARTGFVRFALGSPRTAGPTSTG